MEWVKPSQQEDNSVAEHTQQMSGEENSNTKLSDALGSARMSPENPRKDNINRAH